MSAHQPEERVEEDAWLNSANTIGIRLTRIHYFFMMVTYEY